jgi:MoaA/NifB/PqqE/SkfB family radical SAM enzyme
MSDHRFSAEGPRETTLYVTDRCNARCVFDGTPCKRETEGGVEHAGDMTVEMVREVLDRFPLITGACIAGFGEPLLHRDLGEILRLLRSREVLAGVITNGILLEHLADAVAKWPLYYLSVSLNATDPAWHEQVFKVRKWDQVIRGILRMVAADVNVGISFVVSRRTVLRIGEMVGLGRALGVKFINIVNTLPHAGPRNLNFVEAVIRDTSAEALAAIEAAKKLPGAELVKVWPAPVPSVSPGMCFSPFMSLGVDAAGSVSGCRRVFEPVPANGNFRDPGVWTNEHYSQYREELTAGPVNEVCRNCFGSVVG